MKILKFKQISFIQSIIIFIQKYNDKLRVLSKETGYKI